MKGTALFIFSIMFMGCIASIANIVDNGLVHKRHGYTVPFTDSAAQNFLGESWIVDNFKKPTRMGSWSRKQGDRYTTIICVDPDDDGTCSEAKVHSAALELMNKETGGWIWMDSTGLMEKHQNRKLDVILDEYVASLAGSQWWRSFGRVGFWGSTVSGSKGKEYSARITESERCTVGSYPAMIATVELARNEQLKLDSNARERIIRILIARTDGMVSRCDERDFCSDEPGKVLLTVGYSENPRYFETNLQSYYKFLNTIRFDNGQPANGLKCETSKPNASSSKKQKASAKTESIDITSTETATKDKATNEDSTEKTSEKFDEE